MYHHYPALLGEDGQGRHSHNVVGWFYTSSMPCTFFSTWPEAHSHLRRNARLFPVCHSVCGRMSKQNGARYERLDHEYSIYQILNAPDQLANVNYLHSLLTFSISSDIGADTLNSLITHGDPVETHDLTY